MNKGKNRSGSSVTKGLYCLYKRQFPHLYEIVKGGLSSKAPVAPMPFAFADNKAVVADGTVFMGTGFL
ncbi:hypothetical protein [Clostridium sp. DJ247]|uniref:hypothetical protein n=1 Tax=Clostridium sp. DJ247 TaxID=2726188 RepID=UPI0016253A24|nr:hypothetical protein [Clostridium sp. DJ247]MBC2581307.1 hypothetical protein [Clostridium sp. DJ247]